MTRLLFGPHLRLGCYLSWTLGTEWHRKLVRQSRMQRGVRAEESEARDR